jgi:hypothetical protein
LANAGSVGIKNVKLVLDGGFISEECFRSLNDACKSFTIGIPSSLDISRKMIAAHIADIDRYANKASVSGKTPARSAYKPAGGGQMAKP